EGKERTISPLLEPGRYRLRAPRVPGSLPLLADERGAENVSIALGPAGWPQEELPVSTHPQLQLKNERQEETLFVLERTAWAGQELTATEETSMQMFRDLFSREALRPNEQLSVGTLTVMFTDLCRSTALYHEIGDAPAFGIVMDHLEIIKGIVAKYDGAFVKAMGDGTLSIFRNPLNALRAAQEAHDTITVRGSDNRPLKLKTGIHTGPCIVINQNERLDYFGSTVNIAARLESLSEGNEMVISSQVYADPEVSDWLQTAPWNLHHSETTLRGFGEKAFPVLRLSHRAA
ncbi:MAG: adenylate/guanylate cyclase domain-containing protein, partial [Bacteroidota bacterium]